MHDKLRYEIERIKERNRRVEADKAWEMSWARKMLIGGFTYAFATIILVSIRAPEPFLNALIPTLGFLLSTMTFDFMKRWWIERRYNG
jgi:hypothetical protein